MRDYFLKALMQVASEDSNVIFITGDLGYGVFEEFERKFPNQYLNLGIAEQSMTGIAVGLALEGKSVITYSIGNFPTLRCLEQIRNDAAYHQANLTIVSIGGGFSYGQLGMSHHATEDLAIMRALPNLSVYAPSTNEEAMQISCHAISKKSTSYIRLDKASADELDCYEEFNFHKIRQFRDGEDIAIISAGGVLEEALQAHEFLSQNENINIGVFGCHSLKPFDTIGLKKIVKKFRKIICIEEHNSIGGLGSLISETLVKEKLTIDEFKHLAIDDTYSSVVGDQKYLRKHYGISSSDILREVKLLQK